MKADLGGRSVLITGATGPVGRALAVLLAAEGCDLQLAARDEADLEDLARQLAETHGARVETHPTPLADHVEVDVLVLSCDHVDVLVTCPAGIVDGREDLGEGWAEPVFGQGQATREMAATMADREDPPGGLIINVGLGTPDGTNAEAANAALFAVTRSLKAERVRILGVEPGAAAPGHVASLVAWLLTRPAAALAGGSVLRLGDGR